MLQNRLVKQLKMGIARVPDFLETSTGEKLYLNPWQRDQIQMMTSRYMGERFEQEMNDAGADWQMILYSGAGHSFTNKTMDGSRPGFAYHEPSDLRSWRAMCGHFAEVFGG